VGIFGTALVVLAVIVILVVSVTSPKTPNGKKPYGSRVAPAAIANAINHVSPAAFAAAGASNTSGVYVGSVKSLSGFPVLTACAVRHGRTGACLKRDGKPLIVYVGSEWCPYCAATRWPFAVALGRFGTFHGLHMTESSLSDVYAGTPSLSFYKTTYTSPYISFQGVEQCTDIPSTSKRPAIQDCNGYLPLETIPTQISKIFGKFDYPPYEPATPPIPGGIPFIDFGNQLHEDGAFMDPSILAGFTHLRVAESLGNPVASPAQSILVGANYYSAMICKLTNNKPASVCEMPVVKEAAAALKAAKI